jgi:tRNA threonylcarbamoyladenosine biosynthesis protein TsaE
VTATAPQEPRVLYTLAEAETREVARTLARTLHGGEVILLEGPLGAGKTVFVRGLVEGLGGNPDDVASPSFVLCREYEVDDLHVFHVDLYRLDEGADLSDLAIDDLVTMGGVVVVEWGEKLPEPLRESAIEVRLADLGEDSRRIEVVDRRPPR